MRMGKHSINYRNYFEKDQEFPDELKRLVDAYNKSSHEAFIYAHRAVTDGGLEHMRKAQWHEAVTQTIEKCLGAYIDIDDPDVIGEVLDMPEPPKFSI